MELGLEGKTALVTGGSRGIGKAIKEELIKEGVNVYSWSRSEGTDLEIVIPNIPSIDILINNFGGAGRNYTDIPMFNNYSVMRHLIKQFINQNKSWGRVITISSIYGKEKGENPEFTASKSAQIAYMKCLAGKYPGTTFNTICPGHIDVGKGWKGGDPKEVAYLTTFLCSDKAK